MANPSQTTAELALRDIHLPDSVSWWPPAPGWWIVAMFLLILIFVFILSKKFYQNKELHRTVVLEIETIKTRYKNDPDQYELIQSLSVLLRRSCISFYPRHKTAGLTGDDWLQYLDNTFPGRASAINNQFYKGVGRTLASSPYISRSTPIDINADALITLCEKWLRAQPVKIRTPRVN